MSVKVNGCVDVFLRLLLLLPLLVVEGEIESGSRISCSCFCFCSYLGCDHGCDSSPARRPQLPFFSWRAGEEEETDCDCLWQLDV